MKDTPQISDAEWQVMKVLWARAPLTASEVADSVREETSWHPKTVKTLLSRLVKKGVLLFEEDGNRYLYSPAAPRERYVAQESRSFVDRVFGGESTPMLLHFVQEARLSESDIQELRSILERKQQEEDRR